jgi:hypothetical protein
LELKTTKTYIKNNKAMKNKRTKSIIKSRRFAATMIMALFLFSLFESKGQPSQQGFSNYITISNGHFWDGSAPFKPMCINYLVDYNQNLIDSSYYIAPHFCYSNIKRAHAKTKINDNSATAHWGYGDAGDIEMDSAGIKLERDLQRIDSLGFNVVRLWPSISWRNNTLHILTGSYSRYFELTDSLIAQCARHNLRVILVLDADTNGFRQFDQYCVYLDSVSRHYSSNKAVMAYVVFAEPGYKWNNPHENDKIMISNWSRKWYYLIKRNAPNQLITYGLDGINNVLFWDPSALTYDFLSMHFYYDCSDINVSKNGVHTHFKWMKENVNDVWVLGETGFSGTSVDSCRGDNPIVGSEEDQREYARFTTWLAEGCDCKGYAWWQYQDANWKSCEQNHYGLFTTYPDELPKLAANIFPISQNNYMDPFSCSKPNCYYDIPGYGHASFSGMVRDQDSNPITDALVFAWSNSFETYYSTFTDSQGEYTIHAPQDTVIGLVWISHKGYTDKSFFHTNNTFEDKTLTRINYNKWKKNWTYENYPGGGYNIALNSSDIVIVGNFCGDAAQELFVIKSISQTAELYKFDVNHWEKVWEGVIGDWQIHSGDKFYAGDFNGNGYDELLCIENATQPLATIFSFSLQFPKYPWQFVWTNLGDGKIGNWSYAPGDVILPGYFNDSTYCSLLCIRNTFRPSAICQHMVSLSWETTWTFSPLSSNTPTGFDKYYVGDFNGDGYDELFCTQVTNGTTDQMKLLQFSNTSWNSLWSNNGISEGIGIYPYRANLYIGNFDLDRADELLGVGSWATKFDFNTSNDWYWSWSTYESGKLSDWAVNPNHRIFFMKTMTDVPDYLFISRGIPRIDYKFDAYSYDP